MMDELFNSLHGVGDVDRELKELVLLIIDDIHDGGRYFSTIDKVEKKEMVVEITKIIAAAIRNRPAVAKAVLKRWMEEVQENIFATKEHE